MRLLCSGDHDAFADFVKQYEEMVFLCCKTLGLTETEAEDVASETFLAAYQKLSTYSGRSKLSTWLWQVAYYKAVDYLRKNRRFKELDERADKQLADKDIAQVAAKLESNEQAEVVWNAVARLPRLWAMAIVLFYREDKSIDEISGIMRKRKNTVKTYLFRGRKRLKETLAGVLGENSNVGQTIAV